MVEGVRFIPYKNELAWSCTYSIIYLKNARFNTISLAVPLIFMVSSIIGSPKLSVSSFFYGVWNITAISDAATAFASNVFQI